MENIFQPWKYVPFIRLIIPFLTGITLYFTGLNLHPSLIVLPIIITIYCLWFEKSSIFKIYKFRYLIGFLITISIILASYFLTIYYVQIDKPFHFSKFLQKESIIVGRIIEMPEEKEKTFKTVVAVSYIINNKQQFNVKGKLLTYLRISDKSKKLSFHDKIIFQGKINEISPPLNPAQFNYKRFLSYKRIYHQTFLGDKDWMTIPQKNAFSFTEKIIKLRQIIIQEIKKAIKTPNEQSVALALLTGYKTDLSDELRNSFAAAGAMHVLAVSGLHVGIISFFFGLLTQFLLKLKFGRHLFLMINLAFIWCYAVLTGLSPSVLRASAMFSFVIFGKYLGRMTNIYSSLYTSLFILLLIDPLMISQVGFQLSYIAVLGIVAFQPRIYDLINLKKCFILDKIWNLTAVSIAAQLATFPLALLYFTIFPVYFLISNLIVIPATTIIMYTGFAFLLSLMTGFDWLTNTISLILNVLLKILNQSVLFIQNLPNGLIDEIYISPIMTFLIYFTIISAFLYLLTLHRKLLLTTLFSILVLYSGFVFWKIKNKINREVIVYSIPNQLLISFFDENKIVFWGDSSILFNQADLKYNTFRDVWKTGHKSAEIIKIPLGKDFFDSTLFIHQQFACFDNIRFACLNTKLPNETKQIRAIKLNYLIIHPKDKNYIEKAIKYYQPSNIVINLNPERKKAVKITEKCKNLNIKCYNLNRTGAIQIRIRPDVDFSATKANISDRIREICSQ